MRTLNTLQSHDFNWNFDKSSCKANVTKKDSGFFRNSPNCLYFFLAVAEKTFPASC